MIKRRAFDTTELADCLESNIKDDLLSLGFWISYESNEEKDASWTNARVAGLGADL